ncbi:Uncharacterised protein [Rodentibacter pneumotropicus]|uniref:Protein PfhB1 n=1 Tax=Rodentibacter pneumotropicus TaxID=758 RepID=A0A3S4W314_9PAST|nr:Uncharacterised protein [Rodentibacter pneumotropicus]
MTANSINADRNLRISTAGNLINQHNLYADESVTLNANHITNRVEGRISSANTQLSAKGNLINEGLINGVSLDDQAKTIVKAGGQLINTGKGRIYGDHVALEADRIENSDKITAMKLNLRSSQQEGIWILLPVKLKTTQHIIYPITK